MTGRWWRRNWWALLLVPALLVGMLLFGPDESYQQWRAARPGEPAQPGPDGWASYGGGELRLVAVVPADLRERVTNELFPVPEGLRAWLVTLTVTLSDAETALAGCVFRLEDQAGRRFGDDPIELSGARLGVDGPSHYRASCRPADEPPPGTPFEITALFAMPSSSQPVAVRVERFGEVDYARFEVL